MLDLLFVLISIGFFAVTALYVVGCEWLIKDRQTAARTDRIETTGEQAGCKDKERIAMPLEFLLVLIVAVLLVGYLTYALLQAEKF